MRLFVFASFLLLLVTQISFYNQAGVFVTTIMLTFFLGISCLAATMLCEAMARIPDNENFEKVGSITCDSSKDLFLTPQRSPEN